MIEVERKFQPTEEQLKALLKDAEFVGDKVNHDVYYDYPDYRLIKKGIRLRNRNGLFELKIKKSSHVHLEIENKKEIEEYFKTDNLEEFIKQNFVVIIEYVNKRIEYKCGEFTIDVDELDFGYNMCEIELMVESDDGIKEAEDKIMNFVKKYGWEVNKILSKGLEYLRIFNNKVYKELI